jgi:hypothetical protein
LAAGRPDGLNEATSGKRKARPDEPSEEGSTATPDGTYKTGLADVLAALAEVHVGVLESVRVSAETGHGVGQAVHDLLKGALAPLIKPLLASVAGVGSPARKQRKKGSKKGQTELSLQPVCNPLGSSDLAAVALRVHHAGVGLLEHCVALSPTLEAFLRGNGPGAAPPVREGEYFRYVQPASSVATGDAGRNEKRDDKGKEEESPPLLLDVLRSLVADGTRTGPGPIVSPHLHLAATLAAVQRLAQLRAGGREREQEEEQIGLATWLGGTVPRAMDLDREGWDGAWDGVVSTGSGGCAASWAVLARAVELWVGDCDSKHAEMFMRSHVCLLVSPWPTKTAPEGSALAASMALMADANFYELAPLRPLWPAALASVAQRQVASLERALGLAAATPSGEEEVEKTEGLRLDGIVGEAEAANMMETALRRAKNPKGGTKQSKEGLAGAEAAAAGTCAAMRLVSRLPVGYLEEAGAAALANALLKIDARLLAAAAAGGPGGFRSSLAAMSAVRVAAAALATTSPSAAKTLARPAALAWHLTSVDALAAIAAGAGVTRVDMQELPQRAGGLLEGLCRRLFADADADHGADAGVDALLNAVDERMETLAENLRLISSAAPTAPALMVTTRPMMALVPRSVAVQAKAKAATILGASERVAERAGWGAESPAALLASLAASAMLRTAAEALLRDSQAHRMLAEVAPEGEDGEEDEEVFTHGVAAAEATANASARAAARVAASLEPAVMDALSALSDTWRPSVAATAASATACHLGLFRALAALLRIRAHPSAISSENASPTAVPLCLAHAGRHLALATRLLLPAAPSGVSSSGDVSSSSNATEALLEYLAAMTVALARAKPSPPPPVHARILALHLRLLLGDRSGGGGEFTDGAKAAVRELVRCSTRQQLMGLCRAVERALWGTGGLETAGMRVLQVMLAVRLNPKNSRLVGSHGARLVSALLALLTRVDRGEGGRGATAQADMAVGLLATMASRAAAYELSPRAVASLLHLPNLLLQIVPRPADMTLWSSLLVRLCSLLAACLRHRLNAGTQRSMGVLVASTQALLMVRKSRVRVCLVCQR